MVVSPPSAARHQDRHIVAASFVIAIEDAGDQARVPSAQAGVTIEVPVRGQAVGMHDQERIFGPAIIKCLDLADRVADGAVMRDHAGGFDRFARRG